MKQIPRFAAVFCASLAVLGAAFADPYRVKDLVVDKVAPTAAEARKQGTDEARVTGAQRLVDRLTLPEDRANARQPINVGEIASRMSRTNTIQQELKASQTTGGGYRAQGVITWTFYAADVRKHLEERGVPYVDTQAALAMVVPVAAQGVDAAAWGAQWTTSGSGGQIAGKSDDTVLTPYIGSTSAWPRRPTWMEIQDELTKVRADHGVIAEAFMQGQQYYVRLFDMRTGAPQPNIGQVGPFIDLGSAQRGAVIEMERAWKVSSVVRTTGSSSVSMTASFADIQQWVKIRASLEASRLVRELAVESLSSIGADISFVYAGRAEQLVADLRSRGVDLSNSNNNWVLRVAAQQ